MKKARGKTKGTEDVLHVPADGPIPGISDTEQKRMDARIGAYLDALFGAFDRHIQLLESDAAKGGKARCQHPAKTSAILLNR